MQPYRINNASVKKALIAEIEKLIVTVKNEKRANWRKVVTDLQYTIDLLQNFSLYTPAPIIKIKSQIIGWDYSENVET